MKITPDQDNVIQIGEARAAHQFPAMARVRAYWEGLRNGRLMPTRDELDPRGIADSLEFAFVLEKVAPGVARMRLAGMHLSDLMGMETRGMPITAMFLPEARREMQSVLETVLEAPAVVSLSLESEHGFRQAKLAAQMILLPLKNAEGRPTRILGALQAKGTIGRGPRRFRILSKQVEPILSDRHLFDRTEEFESERAGREPVMGFAEPTARFDGKPKARKTEQHPPLLRLVHDADGRAE